MSKHVTLLDR